MTHELALLVMVAAALLLVGLGLWAWLRRSRRDAAYAAPVGEIPADAEVVTTVAGFYVATTVHEQPLERLAIRGLGFRSRVDVTVTTGGVALDLPGQPRFFLAADRLVAADRATVAIDRVVERDGLVRIVWRIDAAAGPTLVDTYLRPQDAPTQPLASAVNGILPATTSNTPTGSAA